MEMADSNGDGKLSYNEWLMTAAKQDKFFIERRFTGIYLDLLLKAQPRLFQRELTKFKL
jgi:hypothetical protein